MNARLAALVKVAQGLCDPTSVSGAFLASIPDATKAEMLLALQIAETQEIEALKAGVPT